MRIHKRYNSPFLFAWYVFFVLAFFVSAESQAQEVQTDSTSVMSNDSIRPLSPDSVASDSTQQSSKKEMLDAPVTYEAQDSIVFLGDGTGFLYGSAAMQYKEIDLKANYIRVKMDSTTIYASGTTDSTGVVSGSPVFTEKDASYEAKEMTYNLNTKKGFIRQVVTQQGEGYIISDKTKKDENDLLYMVDGKYTTCDNHEHPHFYLQLTKAKVKPGDYVAAGPAYLVVADVPLPLAIPFGFFPFTSQYSSGIIMPNYGDDSSRGFYLQGGGYYFAINDYFDLELLGDIYTKGTWAVTANTNYVKRYKFRGSFNLTYRNDVTSEKDLPDYSVAKNLSIRWSHSQDAKANPYSTFSASVNFSTSGYNRSNINSYYNPELNSENTKSSSVSFTQRFPNNSPWSISGSATITQRTKDSTINMTLPSLSINMSRIYPFKRKNPTGKERWYEKISLSYTGTLSNSIETKENKLLHSSFTKDWKNGVNHNIPISASFNVLKYINISPSASYTERWYFKRVDQSWDEENNEVKMDTTNGFYRVYNFNVGISASTKLYGFFIPSRKIFGDKIDRFRHVLTPSIGFTWAPDFGNSWFNYYGTYEKPVTNYLTGEPDVETVTYSRYAGALYGTPGRGKTGSITFSLANNLEMKVRNDRDTTGENPFKVISLIDNFSVNGSYNIAADSMKWSNFNATLRLKFKNYSLNLTGSFDPYMYGLTESGSPVRIDELRWNHGKFPRFLGTSTSYSYTFNNDTFKKWFGKKDKGQNQNGENPDETSEDTEDSMSDTPPGNSGDNSSNGDSQTIDADGYAKVSVPWSISISYTLRYAQSSNFNYDKMEYDMKFTHNLSLSGSIGLGAGWKISTSTSYDFDAKKFSYSSFNVSRSLHCWSMSGSFVPFGIYKSYTFKIGVNASMLADLKYEKQSEYGRSNVNWW